MVLLESLFVAENLLMGTEQVADVLLLLEDEAVTALAILLNLQRQQLHFFHFLVILLQFGVNLLQEVLVLRHLLHLLAIHYDLEHL
jgi:hypothetical protein